MNQDISLNGAWDLRDEFGFADAIGYTPIQEGWIRASVPGDIHQGPINAGKINELLIGLNSFECD